MTPHPTPAAQQIDTADIVRHEPSGEEWVVACVNGEYLSWAGWPEGRAKLADCTLVRKATPEKRELLLQDLARINGSDHRCTHARAVLAAAQAPQPEPAVSTPAQPAQQGELTDEQIRDACFGGAGTPPGWEQSGLQVIRRIIAADRSLRAPPAPPAVEPAEHPVFAFLDGSGPLEGVWFGEPHPTEQGKFWWRKHLRAAMAPTLSASAGAQSTETREPKL